MQIFNCLMHFSSSFSSPTQQSIFIHWTDTKIMAKGSNSQDLGEFEGKSSRFVLHLPIMIKMMMRLIWQKVCGESSCHRKILSSPVGERKLEGAVSLCHLPPSPSTPVRCVTLHCHPSLCCLPHSPLCCALSPPAHQWRWGWNKGGPGEGWGEGGTGTGVSCYLLRFHCSGHQMNFWQSRPNKPNIETNT